MLFLARTQSVQGRSFCFSDVSCSVKGLIVAVLKEPEAACSNVGNRETANSECLTVLVSDQSCPDWAEKQTTSVGSLL